MFKTKGQDEISEELSEVEIGNPLEEEFRIVIIKMNEGFRRRMDAQSKKLVLTKRNKKNGKQGHLRCCLQGLKS